MSADKGPYAPGSVDLRSDTVTKPTEAMKQAMVAAEVGDDVYMDDPTVLELEAKVAAMLGKEAALFFPTATMSNLTAAMAHCSEGNMNEAIIADRAHMAMYEVGNLATIGRIFTRTMPTNPDGTMNLDAVEAALELPDVHCTTPKLMCIENTNCFLGGRVLPMSYITAARAIADDASPCGLPPRGYAMKLHCDGARLWHAAVEGSKRGPALGLPADLSIHQALRHYAAPFDSISVCLSKGIGAPVGSVLASSADTIAKSRHIRKMLGGGMRQVGFLAAAALHGLEHRLPRLGDDHDHAQLLCDTIGKEPGVVALPRESNMAMFRIDGSGDERLKHRAIEFSEELAAEGLHVTYMSRDVLRMVAHVGVEAADCERAADIFIRTFRRFRAKLGA